MKIKPYPRITQAVFNAAIARKPVSGAWIEGARMVLVDGISGRQAAKLLGVARSTIIKGIERILSAASSEGVCPCCGQALAAPITKAQAIATRRGVAIE